MNFGADLWMIRLDLLEGEAEEYLLVGSKISQLDIVLLHFALGQTQTLTVIVSHPSQLADQSKNDSLLHIAEKEVSSWIIPVSFLWVSVNSLSSAKKLLFLTKYLTYALFKIPAFKIASFWSLNLVLRRKKAKKRLAPILDPMVLRLEGSIEGQVVKSFEAAVLMPHDVFPGDGTIEEYRDDLSGALAIDAANQFGRVSFTAPYPFYLRTGERNLPPNLQILPPDNPRHSKKWLNILIQAGANQSRPASPSVAFSPGRLPENQVI